MVSGRGRVGLGCRLVLAAVLAVAAASTASTQPRATPEVKITRVEPVGGATARSIFTVSFDQPMVESVEAAHVRGVRLERAPDAGSESSPRAGFTTVDARIEWRDPVTLRIAPRAPLDAAATYRIVVDTPLVAVSGARLRQPFTTSIAVEPILVRRVMPSLPVTGNSALSADGMVRLLTSRAVDSASWSDRVSLALDSSATCAARRIPYTLVAQRRPTRMEIQYRTSDVFLRGDIRDTLARTLEYAPTSVLPYNCVGVLSLPAEDPRTATEQRYRVSTPAPFQLVTLGECQLVCADTMRIRFHFSAAVSADSLQRYVRIEPPPSSEVITGSPGIRPMSGMFDLRGVFPRHTAMRVLVDSALRDAVGRPYTGPRQIDIQVPDRRPFAALADDPYLVLPRGRRAVLRVHHVNVDSVVIDAVPVPDSVAMPRLGPAGMARLTRTASRALASNAVRAVAAVSAASNTEGVTMLRLPDQIEQRGGSWWVRVMPHTNTPGLIYAGVLDSSAFGLVPLEFGRDEPVLLRMSDLAVHARTVGSPSAVFVTSLATGRPVRDAAVRLVDVDGQTLGAGVTAADGVATIFPKALITRNTPAERAVELQRRFAPDDEDIWQQVRAKAHAVVATVGSDTAWLPLHAWPRDGWPNPWLAGARVGNDRQQSVSPALRRVEVFTDRAIYRPGERVFLGAVVREMSAAGLRPPAGDSIQWKLEYRMNFPREATTIANGHALLSSAGTMVDSITLPSGAAVAAYSAVAFLYRLGEWREVGRKQFRVAEYRTPDALVRARATADDIATSDTASFNVSGTYLHGAPMSGGQVRWTISLHGTSARTVFPLLPEGFEVGAWRPWAFGYAYNNEPNTTVEGLDSLDSDGQLVIRATLPPNTFVRPVVAELAVGVSDITRQELTTAARQHVHASDYYLTARISHSRLVPGDSVSVSFMALNHRSGIVRDQPVHLALVRWRRSATPTPGQPLTTPLDTAWRRDLRTEDSLQTVTLAVDSAGVYELLLSSRDQRGRTVYTSFEIVASQEVPAPPRAPTRVVPVRILTEQPVVGGSARIAFDSPFADAEAWLTIEREGVLWQDRRRVRGGTHTFSVPVEWRFAPGAYVGVTLVARTDGAATTHIADRTQFGFTYLTVDATPARLIASVSADRAVYRPRDTAEITVQVRGQDGAGVVSNVTVWAVDQANLSLSGYSPPDPYHRWFAQVRYELQPHSLLSYLSRDGGSSNRLNRLRGAWFDDYQVYFQSGLLRSSGFAAAGGIAAAAPMAAEVRSDFRATAFFAANLQTDSSGVVTYRAQLPDNVTSYRLFALAVDSTDRSGVAQDSLRTFLPLVVRAALPRFVRGGDSLSAGAVVSTADGADRPVTVSMHGIGILDSQPREIRTVARTRGEAIRTSWRIPERSGDTEFADDPFAQPRTVQFEMHAVAADASDAVRLTLPVRPTGRPQTFSLSASVKAPQLLSLALPPGTDTVRTRVRLRIGSGALAYMREAADYALAYPYPLTEQLASSLRAIVATLQVQRAGAQLGVDSLALHDRAQQLIVQIEERVNADGSIRVFPFAQMTSVWLTAYAGIALQDARDAALRESTVLLTRVGGFLRTASIDTTWRGYGSVRDQRYLERHALATDLSRAWFLRRLGDSLPEAEARLRTQAAQLAWEDRAWYAHYEYEFGDPSRAAEMLSNAWHHVRTAGALVDLPDAFNAGDVPSTLRGGARLAAATRIMQPEHPLLGALVERLVHRGTGRLGFWCNTQDIAWTSNAIAPFAIASLTTPASIVASHTTDRSRIAPVSLTARAGSVADTMLSAASYLSRLGDSIVLAMRVSSEGGTYVALEVETVSQSRPVTPDARGLTVERWYERASDGTRITEAKAGDLVRVVLRVRAPFARDFVALEDLLPAGLEVVDPSLRNASGTAALMAAASVAALRSADAEALDEDAASWGWSTRWNHTELHDDRVQFFARYLWPGSHTASYLTRATTSGRFVRPPAQALEMYNPGVQGRTDGGWFRVGQ